MGTAATPVALVTGASRGIGAATSVALSEAGFDVAITARTVRPADAGDRPGSLEETAAAIEATGGRALAVQMDLLDRASVEHAVDHTLDTWGRIDVVVNNAVHQGRGSSASVLETSVEDVETALLGDIVNQFALVRRVLPHMRERGSGIFVNMTSAVAFLEPRGPIGAGGWGLAYGMGKGGFDRMAGLLNADLRDEGIVAYNIEPGFVAYGDRLDEIRARHPGMPVTPPEVIGAAVAWLVTSPDAHHLLGKRIHGPRLAADRDLVPGWSGPS